MHTFSPSAPRNVRKGLAPTAAAASLCAATLLGLGATPAHADSPVSPIEHEFFVIGPEDGGACSFPVQWDVTGRIHGIDRPPSFLAVNPDFHLTLTNLDTGKTWAPGGDGTISYQDQPDGSVLRTLYGVDYSAFTDQQFIGTWSRYYYPDTNTSSDWVGHGKIVNICDRLS